MTNKEFRELREKLEVQRGELQLRLTSLEQETRALDLDIPQDSGDRSVINLSKETLFEQGSQRRGLLRRIEGAIDRIDDGSFGTCLGCGQEIAVRRLQALPWTQYCLQCQEIIERGSEQDLSPGSAPLRRAG
jgi:DnaK suppressor protein